MIRVNLLRQQERTHTGMSAATQATGATSSNFRSGMSNDLMKKAAGFFAPIFIIYAYNFMLIKQSENQIEEIAQQQRGLEAETQALEPQLTQIAKYRADKESIQKEVDEIKGLSLGRYKTIKILDTIQTIMPQKAWLTNFELKGDTVNLSGNALEDIAISSFIEELDRSLYFKEISWIDSREAKAENGETVKTFKLAFKLENL